MYRTKVGVDLAKEVIQVCIYRNKKVQSNIEMTPNEFSLLMRRYILNAGRNVRQLRRYKHSYHQTYK